MPLDFENILMTILFSLCTVLYVLLTGWYIWGGIQNVIFGAEAETLFQTVLRASMIYVLTIGYSVILEGVIRDIVKYKLAHMLGHDEALFRETLQIFHQGGAEARRRLYTHLPFWGRFLTGTWDVQWILLLGPIFNRVSTRYGR